MTTRQRVSVDNHRRTQRIFESMKAYARGDKPRVDRIKGILFDVKVLGQRSSNGRRYTPDCIRNAARLYEGVSVKKNHPKDPEDQRDVDDTIGWLRNVRIDEQGDLRADLHYFKSHSFTPRLLESVDRNPHAWGLSHNSSGDTERANDGTLIVHEITEVRSVDLVDSPATCSSLFESRQPRRSSTMATTLLEHFTAIKLLPRDRKNVRRLFEADGPLAGMDDLPMATGNEPTDAEPMATEDPVDQSPEEALKGGFDAACHLIIDDTAMSADDKIRRLKDILKTHDRMVSSGEAPAEEEAPVEESEGEESEEEEKPLEESEGQDDDMLECDDEEGGYKAMKESKDPKVRRQAEKLELATLRRKESVRDLCESEGYSPTALDMKALCGLRGKDTRLEYIGERKLAVKPNKPRTATPITEGRGAATTTNNMPADPRSIKDGDTEAFVKFLTGGRN